MKEYKIVGEHLTKQYKNRKVVNDVSMHVVNGEIYGLVGPNGAGKSTMLKMLLNLTKPDMGEFTIDGVSVQKNGYQTLRKVGAIIENPYFYEQLTGRENLELHCEYMGYPNLEEIDKVLGLVSLKNIDGKHVSQYSIGMKQRLAIARAILTRPEILILDEPTAVLTPQEVEELFKILRSLKEDGKTIIFITHKLNETMELSDRITVLRKGKKVVTLNKEETSPAELAYYMVGRDVNFEIEKEAVKTGDVILSVKGLKLLEKSQSKVDFTVKAGEILGIAGVEGNGQLELEEIIMGLRKPLDGEIFIKDENITHKSVHERREMGIGYIPSDRHKRAMVKEFSIKENFLLGYQDSSQFTRNKFVKYGELTEYSKEMIEKFDIKVPGPEHTIGNLSGGNQQKVILSREVSHSPELIIAAQPIRGLDIGAIEFIHNILLELRSQGKAILLISAELSEIMKLSDRIAVFYEGEINGLVNAGELEREEIGLLMAGERLEKYGK